MSTEPLSKMTKLRLAREERAEEILNDSSLSSLDKLATLEEERIWLYAAFIQDEFSEWEVELLKKFKEEVPQHNDDDDDVPIMDSIFSPSHMRYEKGAQVSYADALQNLVVDGDDDDPLIPVLETRSKPVVRLQKRLSEIADKVLEFCKQNEIVGFVNDW